MNIDIQETADFFKALGDPTRIRIVQLLAEDKKLCVGALADRIKISQPAVSQHLKILKSAGIVLPERMGYHIHYSINTAVIVQYGLALKNMADPGNTGAKTVYIDRYRNTEKGEKI